MKKNEKLVPMLLLFWCKQEKEIFGEVIKCIECPTQAKTNSLIFHSMKYCGNAKDEANIQILSDAFYDPSNKV
jgi:hypothetical protein